MERIKLANPGEELTMTVSAVSTEEIESNNYYKLTDGATEILIPSKSADRQLDRVGVSHIGELISRTIRISRSKELNKFGKPYWNLDAATASSKPPAPPRPGFNPPGVKDADLSESLRAQDEKADKIDELIGLYIYITDKLVPELDKVYKQIDIGLSPEAAQAAVATVVIQMGRTGLV